LLRRVRTVRVHRLHMHRAQFIRRARDAHTLRPYAFARVLRGKLPEAAVPCTVPRRAQYGRRHLGSAHRGQRH